MPFKNKEHVIQILSETKIENPRDVFKCENCGDFDHRSNKQILEYDNEKLNVCQMCNF